MHWGDNVAQRTQDKGPLVLGIDPQLDDIPGAFKPAGAASEDVLRRYVSCLVEIAAPDVGFVKFQSAFFEAHGLAGLRVLAEGIKLAKQAGLAVILDAKRGDIGSTSKAYADAYLTPPDGAHSSDLEVDCLTVNPFLGLDGVAPFTDAALQHGKGLFILVRTSNAGSKWLQDKQFMEGDIVHDYVARTVGAWPDDAPGESGLSSIGAVVGATHADTAKSLRALMPNAIILAPGLGAQGGGVDVIKALARPQGDGVLAPVSRGLTKVEDLHMSEADYRSTVKARIESYNQALA